jgi:hypothetical protein
MSLLRALLDRVIDYAGFSPPASLSIAEAVRNYAAYRDGEHAWALSRFVTPAARLAEVEATAREFAPFRLSVLSLPGVMLPDYAPHSIDVIEVKAESPRDIASTMRMLPEGVTAYFEISTDGDPAALIGMIAEAHARAKIRTGGLTPDLFPPSAELARFIGLCARAKVPFKATAGLHHAIRGIHSLTYEPDSPSSIMYGFLNVFLASALIYHGGTENDAVHTLEEQSAEAFRFDDAGVSWHGHRLGVDEIGEARKNFAISFGSCSFEEPIGDLQALGLL